MRLIRNVSVSLVPLYGYSIWIYVCSKAVKHTTTTTTVWNPYASSSSNSKQPAFGNVCACACVSALLCAVTIQSNHFCAMIICQNYINVASVVKYSIFLDVDVCVCVSGLDQL